MRATDPPLSASSRSLAFTLSFWYNDPGDQPPVCPGGAAHKVFPNFHPSLLHPANGASAKGRRSGCKACQKSAPLHAPPRLVHVRGGVEKSIFFYEIGDFFEIEGISRAPGRVPRPPLPSEHGLKKSWVEMSWGYQCGRAAMHTWIAARPKGGLGLGVYRRGVRLPAPGALPALPARARKKLLELRTANWLSIYL